MYWLGGQRPSLNLNQKVIGVQMNKMNVRDEVKVAMKLIILSEKRVTQ